MTDDINFCKQCGANLRSVRDAMLGRESTGESFDWSKTWLAEMFMSEQEQRRRRAALELSNRPEDVAAAEIKRLNELKAGVITACVGVGVSIFLAILMSAIADSVATSDPEGAVIMRHVWAAGIIPFMVGVALIVNSVYITPRFSKIRELVKSPGIRTGTGLGRTTGELPALEAPAAPMTSVTEHTTNLLVEPEPAAKGDPERRWARE
jgi:hypothetical protein